MKVHCCGAKTDICLLERVDTESAPTSSSFRPQFIDAVCKKMDPRHVDHPSFNFYPLKRVKHRE